MLLFGLLTVLAACGVVFSHKTVHSALFLVATFFLIAVHFALLGADFLAALEVMVYAGAIMVLVVFVILLLGLRETAGSDRLQLRHYVGVVFLGLFVAVLSYASSHPATASLAKGGAAVVTDMGSPKMVGAALYSKYLLTLELTSILLLAAVIGAVVLAHVPKRPLPAGRGLRAKRTNLGAEMPLPAVEQEVANAKR